MASLDFQPTGIEDLQDLHDWTRRFLAEQYPVTDVSFWREALASNLTTDSSEFWQAVARSAVLNRDSTTQSAFNGYDLDALTLPTDYAYRLGIYAGYPVLIVPSGFNDDSTPVSTNQWEVVTQAQGRPCGLSFVGKRYGEAELIRNAYAFEPATMFRYQQLPLEKGIPQTQLEDVLGQTGLDVRCADALGLPVS